MVVDYRMGNLKSVVNALTFVGADAFISEDKADVAKADAFVLPGVGAFGEAMENLQRLDLEAPLRDAVVGRKKPLLGICLGMQLLAESSEEKGRHRGLGWIPGEVVRLSPGAGLRLPHVGWNSLEILRPGGFLPRADQKADYYFVHSYHVRAAADVVVATCRYGEPFAAALRADNIFAVQFHPEKSQWSGLQLLRGFAAAVQAGEGPAC